MKLDPILTRKVQEWLNAPESERDIKDGATLMLQLNRNRALYNSVMLRPEKFKDKLVYELKKYLRIRLDNMTVSEVSKMETEVMPRAQETIDNMPVISTDAEITAGSVARGKRPDHDSLPASIRELWDSNEQRYRSIVLLYNELKAMSDTQPCDRYEKLRLLDEADKKYRSNLRQYDAYVATPSEPAATVAANQIQGADMVKAVGAARKTISKYKKVIAAAQDPEKIDTAKSKIQAAVDVIRNAGAEFSDATVQELTAIGIKFE